MSCQAMPTLIGEYEIMPGQCGGCLINIKQSPAKITASQKSLDSRKYP
jgi:hypothetical protein